MASPQAPVPPSPKRGSKLPLLIAGVLLAAGGGFVAYQRLWTDPARHAEPPPEEPGTVELEPFVLNLADPMGDRFVRVGMSVFLDRKSVAERSSGGLGLVKLRDRIIATLSSARASELASLEGKEALRRELIQAIQSLMNDPPFLAEGEEHPARVQELLFTAFLLQ
jgi:flagellar FliL protein